MILLHCNLPFQRINNLRAFNAASSSIPPPLPTNPICYEELRRFREGQKAAILAAMAQVVRVRAIIR